MYLVGLTGGIGSGKSTAVEMLRNLRCVVIDAEEITNSLLKPGACGWKKIKKYFGPEAFLDSGEINRNYIDNLVYTKPEKNQLFVLLILPMVRSKIMWSVIRKFFCGYQFVIINLPLLFENRVMTGYLTYTIVLNCLDTQQVERLVKMGKVEAEAKSCVNIQMNLSKKCEMATFVVDNSSNQEYTEEQLARVVRLLRKSKAQWKSRTVFFFGIVSVSAAIAGVYYAKTNNLLPNIDLRTLSLKR
ncbi:dephospho-CoA kinase domain-containing protein-like [Argonauta hians]